jgi:hypothetical protein
MKGKIFGGMVVAAMLVLGISNSAFAGPGCRPHGHSGFYVGINGAIGSVGFYSGGYAPAYYRPVPPPPPPPVIVQVPVYQGGYYRRPHRCNEGYNNGYNNGYNGNYNNGGNCNNGYNNSCGQGNGYYQPKGYNNDGGYYNGR